MFRALFLALLLALTPGAFAQFSLTPATVTASLVADTEGIQPGHAFTVGLLFKIKPGWHTYWRYAGDFGIPTTLDWKLPPGWKAGPIEWPLPQVNHDAGDILSYAYSGQVLHLVTITPPNTLIDRMVTLKALAKWLMCEKECVPGQANVSLTLPVSDHPQAANAELFAKYRALLPQPQAPPFPVSFSCTEKGLRLKVGPNAPDALDFYPIPPGDLPVGHPTRLNAGARGTVVFEIPIDSMPATLQRIDGLLVEGANTAAPKSWLVEPTGENQASGASADAGNGAPGQVPSGNLLHFLLLGLLGGLILNVMPCVLPVISLKILGFVQQAGRDRQHIFRLGLAFTAGVFGWFIALAGMLIALQVAGKQVNWGFQFQNPWFVALMFALVLLFSLNLLGVFELILPGGLSDRMGRMLRSDGYRGAFANGLFATVLGSSCTVPMLGSSIGFALAQPPLVIVAVFLAIATGMALPYFLLTAQPAWLRFLPKPGMWMVRVKQVMGVMMLLTALWLGWVLWQQQTKVIEPFPPQLAKALQSGRPVFVDFTADWCLNCKANERLVLNTAEVQAAFKKNNVLVLTADWTKGDPAIGAILKQFGRAGVPLYVFYPAGMPDQPHVLPELLTKQIVVDAVQSGQPSS
ncbi:MAG: thioredoxin family protein [Chthoniobacteraceae bacterium]